MKCIKIVADDGSINGWFVSLILTLSRLSLYIGCYFVPGLVDVETKVGASFTAFTLTSVGSWFAYKVLRGVTQ